MKLLAWLFFMLCSQVLLSLADESRFTPEHGGSQHFLQEEKLQGVNEMNLLKGEGQTRLYVGDHEQNYLRKAQRGKGVYGGADITRRPRNTASSASSLLGKPSSFISTTLVHVSIGLLLVFLYFF